MISCSGSGLPMHAQLLRLFVVCFQPQRDTTRHNCVWLKGHDNHQARQGSYGRRNQKYNRVSAFTSGGLLYRRTEKIEQNPLQSRLCTYEHPHAFENSPITKNSPSTFSNTLVMVTKHSTTPPETKCSQHPRVTSRWNGT